MSNYEANHRWVDYRMRTYFHRNHSNYQTVKSDILQQLDEDADLQLFANNMTSRIEFARIVLQHAQSHVGIQTGPLCAVAITPARYALPMPVERRIYKLLHSDHRRFSTAACFDIRVLQSLAREALGDIPFIGMVEPALYLGWGPTGLNVRNHIAWHVHLITWGFSKKDVEAALVPLKKRHRSLLGDDVPAAYIQNVRPGGLEQKVVYMLKTPQKHCRMVRSHEPRLSRRTGLLKLVSYNQKKDWLRSGDRARLMDIMGNRTLDQLIFGNVATPDGGTTLVRQIVAEARQPLVAMRREEDERIARQRPSPRRAH